MIPSIANDPRAGANLAIGAATPGPTGISGTIHVIWKELTTDGLATFFLALALVVGFLHGWLKLKYPSTFMAFAFDLPLFAALGTLLASIPRGTPWFPPCGVSLAVKTLLTVCAIWAVLPFPVPWLAAIASYRAWCLAPSLFILGYHLFRTVRKIELLVWLVMLLALASAIYGIYFQTEAEVRELMKNNPELQRKLVGNFYSTSTGAEFRRFSTFVSAAVFGTTMAACAQLAVSRMFMIGCGLIERGILLVISSACSYAVILSGSRTSLIILAASILITAIVVRGKLQWVVLPGIVAGALYLGVASTKGGAGERFGTILESDTLFMRVFIVFSPMMDALAKAPLGNGVGSIGYGVPAVLGDALAQMRLESNLGDLPDADGDLGRLGIDLGLVGLMTYGFLLYHGTRDSFRWMWTLRNSPLGVVGVPAGAWFFLSLIQIPTGSPYLGIPNGALTWILFGALRRLIDEYEAMQKVHGDDVDSLPQFVSFIRAPKLASLFGGAGARAKPPVLGPRGATPTPDSTRPILSAFGSRAAASDGNKPTKRFLFPGNRSRGG
jgi:hypothetical protein